MTTSSSSGPEAMKDNAVEDDRTDATTSGGDSGQDNSISPANSNNRELHSGKKKSISAVDDYNSILTAFDEYAAKGKSESVGFGFEVGDMVWGKVKSHPWWPGQIYNDAFASSTVRKSKREGHVLVAFFGDSSYGWFEPAELIPFEENFAEKSRQMVSRAFLNAVEEAVDELARRRSLGLACRCRNQFNFWPCSVEGYFVVDVGDSEPGFYSLGQISKARDSFNPLEMVSFVEQLALAPMNDQHSTIEFIRNKATVLACRKALFEEFDDTYAQAFGTAPERRPQRTAPVALDPSKATLNGRLVIAEALGKGNISIKPQTKNIVDKDKYLSKGLDGQTHVKSKKAVSSGIGDLAHQTAQSSVIEGEHQPMSHLTSMATDIKTFGASRRHVEGGAKKAKVQKRLAGELSSYNTEKKKKRKKEINFETSGDHVKPPVTVRNSVAMQNVSGMPVHVPLGDNNLMEVDKDHIEGSPSSPVMAQQAVDIRNSELLALVRDLRDLALNPFHGKERRCPDIIRRVFWKYRSLVYKKSLVLFPPSKNEASEAHSISAAGDTGFDKPIAKSTVKLMKPSVRPGDPTIGGRKQCPSDHPDDIKRKKMLDGSKGIIKKKQLNDSDDINKKKKIGDLKKKLSAGEKKIPHRSTESLVAVKNVAPSLAPKAVKLESSKRLEPSVRSPIPTMLVMKFPNNAALPSGAQLRAKFARFGPLDHSATRIFWKSYQCRLVYKYKVDAEAALKFAVESSSNLFGNSNVRSYIRELEVEAAETEPVRIPKEDSLVEQRAAPKISSQQSAQLKSCLKKPSGDEGGGRGNNTRVKFVLGGEESSSKNLLSGASSSTNSSVNATSNISSKNLPKLNPQSSITTLAPSTSHFENFPMNTNMNMPFSEKVATPRVSFNVLHTQQITRNDISQQMIYLLKRCTDVVNNLTGVLGYVPYHPL